MVPEKAKLNDVDTQSDSFAHRVSEVLQMKNRESPHVHCSLSILDSFLSTLDSIQCESREARFLVARLHIEAG